MVGNPDVSIGRNHEHDPRLEGLAVYDCRDAQARPPLQDFLEMARAGGVDVLRHDHRRG